MNKSFGEELSEQDIADVRKDFPALNMKIRDNQNLIYMDWAATSQKPLCVIDTEQDYYSSKNGAINRGTHYLADEATVVYEKGRETVASFFNADVQEIVFTLNATDALNMVANAFILGTLKKNAPFYLSESDEIVVTKLDHHANVVPWQRVAELTGAKLKWINVTEDGALNYDDLLLINSKTKLVAFTHASNVTGVVSKVSQIVSRAKKYGAFTVLDTCQSAPHIRVDVKELDIDFACFSAHKMLGPTGIGALYAKGDLLDKMEPLRVGGSMVDTVTTENTSFKNSFYRHEAGTLMNAQISSWTTAIEYLSNIGMDRIARRESQLLEYLYKRFSSIEGIRIIGQMKNFDDRLPVISFVVDGVHPHDVAQFADNYGIAMRSGHHCAQIVHSCFNTYNSSRISLSFLNTYEEIDKLIDVLSKVREYFHV